jgi:hypothetical protein
MYTPASTQSPASTYPAPALSSSMPTKPAQHGPLAGDVVEEDDTMSATEEQAMAGAQIRRNSHIAPTLPTDAGLPVPKATHHIHFPDETKEEETRHAVQAERAATAHHDALDQHASASHHALDSHQNKAQQCGPKHHAKSCRDTSSAHHDLTRNPHTSKTLIIGSSRKPTEFPTSVLTTASPHFARLFATDPAVDNLVFIDVDDFAFKIWMRWVYTGELGTLSGAGAEDFHALTHYVGVYCLATKWEMERLGNEGRCLPLPS